MGKRGRPRKRLIPDAMDVLNDGKSIEDEDLRGGNPTEISPQELNKTDNPAEKTDSSDNSLEDTSTMSEKLPHDRFPLTEIPGQWNDVPILELAKQGWYYRARSTDKSGSKYMFIRNRTNEKSLGRWSPEAEKLLFERYPILYKPKGVEELESSTGKGLGSKPFFNVPVKRVAVIPGDYRPTIDVIRYYNIYKNNGFLGDFSDFMNGITVTHFVKCHGIVLPVFVNEELIQ